MASFVEKIDFSIFFFRMLFDHYINFRMSINRLKLIKIIVLAYFIDCTHSNGLLQVKITNFYFSYKDLSCKLVCCL